MVCARGIDRARRLFGLEDNEAIKFVQDGMKGVPNGKHLVKLDPANPAGSSEYRNFRNPPFARCTNIGARK